MKNLLCAVGIGLIVGGFASAPTAQTPTSPTFEVASVKPNTSGGDERPTLGGIQPGGRVMLWNIPLRVLIRNAYQLQDRQIVGVPGWASSERFDIEARAGQDLPTPRPGGAPGPTQLMMQSLLRDRFKLAAHTETRELQAYVIELARSNGTLGPQLRRSIVDCNALVAARQRSGAAPQDTSAQCGFRSQGGRASGGEMKAGGFPLLQLSTVLSQIFQDTVVDRTGLTGDYDWELKWDADALGSSLMTAMQDQLGLRLRSAKTPIDVLVVDHVERPTPD